MARFVLVHGGMHAAWCWTLLVPELRRHGAEAVAIDLPGHGSRRSERATLTSYRDAMNAIVRDGDILVGHSLGGAVISVAADAAIARGTHLGGLVYLAATVPPGDGRSILEDRDDSVSSAAAPVDTVDRDGVRFLRLPPREAARERMYHDCRDEVADWALDQLAEQALEPLSTPIVLDHLDHLDRDAVASHYIECTDDRMIDNGWVAASVGRLGVSPHRLATSHSPFLSAPAELAALLVAL